MYVLEVIFESEISRRRFRIRASTRENHIFLYVIATPKEKPHPLQVYLCGTLKRYLQRLSTKELPSGKQIDIIMNTTYEIKTEHW